MTAPKVRTRLPEWETQVAEPVVELPAAVLAVLEAAVAEPELDTEPDPAPPAAPDPLASPGPDWHRVVARTPEAVDVGLRALAVHGQHVERTEAIQVRAGKKALWLAYGKVHRQPRYTPPKTNWRRAALVTGTVGTVVLAATTLIVWWIISNISAIVGGLVAAALIVLLVALLKSGKVCPGCLCGTCGGH